MLLLFVSVAVISLGAHGCAQLRARDGHSIPLTEKEKKTLSMWYGHDDSAEGAREIAEICLRHGLARDQVLALVGAPHPLFSGPKTLSYGFAPSQMMSLHFDDGGRIISAEVNNEWIGPKTPSAGGADGSVR
jgi:hypothetical protein